MVWIEPPNMKGWRSLNLEDVFDLRIVPNSGGGVSFLKYVWGLIVCSDQWKNSPEIVCAAWNEGRDWNCWPLNTTNGHILQLRSGKWTNNRRLSSFGHEAFTERLTTFRSFWAINGCVARQRCGVDVARMSWLAWHSKIVRYRNVPRTFLRDLGTRACDA